MMITDVTGMTIVDMTMDHHAEDLMIAHHPVEGTMTHTWIVVPLPLGETTMGMVVTLTEAEVPTWIGVLLQGKVEKPNYLQCCSQVKEMLEENVHE